PVQFRPTRPRDDASAWSSVRPSLLARTQKYSSHVDAGQRCTARCTPSGAVSRAPGADPEADRESGHASRRGPGASEDRSVRASRTRGPHGPPESTITPEEVCKPDSVPPLRKQGQQPFVWSPGYPRDRATDPRERADHPHPAEVAGSPSYSVLLRVGFAEHPFSRTDLASSYLAFSPLLRAFGPGRSLFC